MAGVTFSDSDSAPVPKFLNPGPDLAIFQIWESDSCSDSGYNHRSTGNLPMFLSKKWLHRLLLLPKWKSDSGSGSVFSQIFDSGSGSGSERKTQNPSWVDSGTRIRCYLCKTVVVKRCDWFRDCATKHVICLLGSKRRGGFEIAKSCICQVPARQFLIHNSARWSR